MLDFYKCSLHDVHEGNFPLNHDCILIVYYFTNSLVSKDFFSCRAQDSASVADILCKLSVVSSVKISSVDDFYM